MPIFTNVQGTWKSVAPHSRKGSVWEVTNGFIKDEGIWKPTYKNIPTFIDAPLIAVKNQNNEFVQVAVRTKADGVHDPNIRRIRITVKIGGTGYPGSPNVGGYSSPNTAGGNEQWSDVWYNNQGVGTNGRKIYDGRTSGTYVFKQFPPTYRKGNKLKPSTRYAFEAWAQHLDGTWSSGAIQYVTTSRSGGAGSTYSSYSTVFFPKRVGTFNLNTREFTEGRATAGVGTVAWFDYGPQVRGLIGDKANLNFWNRLQISRVKGDSGQPTARMFAGRTGPETFNTAVFSEQQYLTNEGSTTAEARISKGERKALSFPKTWRDNIAEFDTFEGFVLMINSRDTAGTFAEYNSQEEDPYQGRLYLRWLPR